MLAEAEHTAQAQNKPKQAVRSTKSNRREQKQQKRAEKSEKTPKAGRTEHENAGIRRNNQNGRTSTEKAERKQSRAWKQRN